MNKGRGNVRQAHRYQAAKALSRLKAQQQRATEKYERKKHQRDQQVISGLEDLFVFDLKEIEEMMRKSFTDSGSRVDLMQQQLVLFDTDVETTTNYDRLVKEATPQRNPAPSVTEPLLDAAFVDSSATSGVSYVNPPRRAEYLLYLCLPASERECLPGDLYEEYNEEIRPRFGERQARWWYWGQVVRSMWPLLSHRILRLITWGAVARTAGALWRRFMP